MTDIAAHLKTVRDKIAAAARGAGRKADAVRLIAVSKGKTAQDVMAAIEAGQGVFGENRVQEAEQKFTDLRRVHPALELHLIGPLQTNKAEIAARLFDVIETLDRPKLAEAMAKAIRKTGRNPDFYIEVNIGGEAQKAGIAPEDLNEFLQFCRAACDLRVTGLMCIPPQGEDPKPYFLKLAALAGEHNLAHLSMGMSGDFEIAVACGATEVRVGTAIFGSRVKP